MPVIITAPLTEFQSPQYHENLERYGEHYDTCLICGKRAPNATGGVQMLTTGEITNNPVEMENSQGWFPVGSDCAKKLVISFVLPWIDGAFSPRAE